MKVYITCSLVHLMVSKNPQFTDPELSIEIFKQKKMIDVEIIGTRVVFTLED